MKILLRTHTTHAHSHTNTTINNHLAERNRIKSNNNYKLHEPDEQRKKIIKFQYKFACVRVAVCVVYIFLIPPFNHNLSQLVGFQTKQRAVFATDFEQMNIM